jgi:hypothetical protein
MPRSAVLSLLLGALVVVVVVGCGAGKTTAQPARQALRICVDRWNQENMLGWGPAPASVSIRRLGSAQLAQLGLGDPALPRCAVSLALVSRSATWTCAINPLGAYVCPRAHEPPRIPLRGENAKTDKHGFLRLDAPLVGTHAAPPLAWQRYPHPDGWIEPWTSSGTLRPGLTVIGNAYRGGGSCGAPSEFSWAKSAFRCLWRGTDMVDPCFPRTADWNRRGAVVACAGQPGDTTLLRFVVTKRS